ncbi:hypothetical protein J1TS1_28430 [Shouchella clausii]|uniref:hypothetical protein n=1 Tax=Shouchella clausii TaxID=79880 RepID=UPI001B033158|nr:hypothetical protein [Shouchella clausii]GIN08698.1 hypothetical protein J1TS1_28430 [Shouchella clausii]
MVETYRKALAAAGADTLKEMDAVIERTRNKIMFGKVEECKKHQLTPIFGGFATTPCSCSACKARKEHYNKVIMAKRLRQLAEWREESCKRQKVL